MQNADKYSGFESFLHSNRGWIRGFKGVPAYEKASFVITCWLVWLILMVRSVFLATGVNVGIDGEKAFLVRFTGWERISWLAR